MEEKRFEDLERTLEEERKSNIRSMTLVDLHALFIFISGDWNKQFGGNTDTRDLIKSRYDMVLAELNQRAYGCDPYSLGKVEVKGDKPEDIDLSKFEEKK